MSYFSETIGNKAGKLVPGATTVTTAGTAVRVTTTSTPIAGVWVAADLGNTNPVVVGDSTVVAASGSQKGLILIPGNQSEFLGINNLNLLWVDSQTNGDELVWLYLQPLSSV